MVNELLDIMISEGMEIKNPQDTLESLSDAIASGSIRALYKFNKPIGFFTWREIWKGNKLYVWINFLCVKKRYRDKSNILSLRKFFKQYRSNPYFQFAYWKQDKDGKFFYAH